MKGSSPELSGILDKVVSLPGTKQYSYFLRTFVVTSGIWYLFLTPDDAKTIQQAFAWALERPGGAWAKWVFDCYPEYD